MNAWTRNLALGGATVLCGLAAPSRAQEAPFPQKGAIEITVLFPAGSSADVTARLLADGMAKQLGASVIVVDRPGAGGAIGYRHVAARKPDGYSLVWNSNSISTAYHSGQLAFDYRAFDPVARVLVEAPVVAVRSESKWKTLGDLVADARSRPYGISVGNSGAGSHTHISSVALFKAAGVEVLDVPFPAAQTVPSLLGGHVDALVQLPAALSDVPTAQEQGFDVSLEAWRGIAAPRGTPKTVVAALEAAIRRTVESRGFASASRKLGVTPAYMPAEEFGALIAGEDATLARLMQLIGLEKP